MTKEDIHNFVCTKCFQPVAMCYTGFGAYLGSCCNCCLTFRADPVTYTLEVLKIVIKE